MSANERMSEVLAAAVTAAEKSVLRVEGRRRGPASGVAWSAEGHVISASHSVEWDEDVRVGLPDGSASPATVIGRDPTTDVVVLKTEAPLAAASWRGLDTLAVGHLVLALSRPGRSARASLGIVSALAEGWRTPMGGRLEAYLQSDVPLQPAFSGGLLVDTSGAALGLNTAGLLRGTATAVPSAALRRVVEAIVAHGQVRRAFLGIGTTPVRLPRATAEAVGRGSGLLIVAVEPDSPAERAGLVLGDTVVALDGTPIVLPSDLASLLDEERIGREARLQVLRVGALQEVAVTVGQRGGRS